MRSRQKREARESALLGGLQGRPYLLLWEIEAWLPLASRSSVTSESDSFHRSVDERERQRERQADNRRAIIHERAHFEAARSSWHGDVAST